MKYSDAYRYKNSINHIMNKQRGRDVHESSLQNPHFTNIKLGKKRVEGRPKRGKFAKMKKGDTVIWQNSANKSETVKTIIVGVRRYNTFREMLEFEGLRRTLPNVNSMDEGVDVYLRPKGFYPNEAQENGVVAIEIKLI